MSSSSDDETDEGKTNLPVTPEQKGNATPECDDSKSRPNNYKSQKSLPGQETAESTEPGPGQTRKPSLGAVTSLPIPQRSHSQDENKPGAKQGKPLQRCPTIHNHTSNKPPPSDQKQNPGNSNGNGQGPPPGTQKRKESVSWSPFGAIGKAMSSGVNIVGDATKAVGTGVVSGTKAVGTGVVSGTKAVGSGVVSVGTGVVKTASAVGDGVIEGTKVVGSGIADVTEMTANAAVSGAKAATAATVNTVNATVDETTNFVKEKKKSVNRHMRRTATYTAGEGDTLGVIAAKYKTTCEDLIELNPQLAERRVQLGEELLVPVGGSRKMSRGPKDSTNFLQGLSISLLEEDDDTEGAEIAETKCLINSDVDFGPRTVTNGYLMLDSGSLTLSWAREDPLTLTQEDITNIALIYGPVELPEFISLLDRNEYNHSAGHSLSEPEVFPVYDEEAELELDSASTATDDRSPAMLHTQDSDDLSLNDSYNRSNSVEDSPGPFPVTGPGNGPRDNGKDANDTQQKNETDEVAIEDGKSCSSDKDHGGDEADSGGRLERKMSRGRRSSSRRRTLSKERRQSLLFEDQMATYCFVEIAESFCPSSKSSAGLEPAPELPPPSPKALSSSGSLDRPAVTSPHWTMTTSSPAFVIRVPNESIVRLFSFLIRNYETKYLCSELPLESGLGFTILTMETLQTRCGEAKIGAKLNPSLSVEGEADGDDPGDTQQNSLPKLHGESEILENEDIEQIQERVPTRLENSDWTLAFTTSRDGFALSTLYRKVQDLDCPILMVIQDVDQVIFGGLLSEPPKVTDSFCGTGESWLFSVDSDSGELKVFNWTTANQLFIKGSSENLVIGSSGGQFGLWFDGDLNKGRTQHCETFGNPPLTPSSDFCVYCLECWAFLPDS